MVKQNPHPDSSLIDDLGGTTKAAAFFDVTPASVSEWRHTGLPRARMMYLRVARPDMFNDHKADRRSGSDRRKTPRGEAA